MFRLLFLFLESARVTVHDSQFKITLIYITKALGAATKFLLCLEQSALSPPPFKPTFFLLADILKHKV